VIGERPGDVDADAARLGIEVVAPAARGPAPHADHVALARDALADLETPHVRAEFGDLARIFVADGHRRRNGPLRPLVPVEDVDVGAADARLAHFYENVVGADLRNRLLLEPEARLRLFLDESAHGFHQEHRLAASERAMILRGIALGMR